MEIHKPKPWHNLREFAAEILTIVIGVLLALTAEQVAESFHWRHEVEAEREALLGEARDNLTAAAYRNEQAACINARLKELEEVFRRQAAGKPLDLKHPILLPPLWIATTGSWDIAVAGQALGHMDQKEKLSFSDAFDTYKAWAKRRVEENAIWGRLELLNHPDILGPGDWTALRQAYGEAISANDDILNVGDYVVRAANFGQKPGKPDDRFIQPRERDFCSPLV